MLDEYGTENWQRETHRVLLAALKLAAGNIKRLRYEIEGAKRDYRDVLGPAEYPGYTKRMFRIGKLAQDEQQRIVVATTSAGGLSARAEQRDGEMRPRFDRRRQKRDLHALDTRTARLSAILATRKPLTGLTSKGSRPSIVPP